MITQLYTSYFQKSRSFLYPLLGLDRESAYQPEGVYLGLVTSHPGQQEKQVVYTPEDRKLVVVFPAMTQTYDWLFYKQQVLTQHALVQHHVQLDDERFMLVYDMACFEDEYDQFLKGQYAAFRDTHKRAISTYYGVHTPEWAYMHAFLFPDGYYRQYAMLLYDRPSEQEKCEAQLRENGQLCDVYDPVKESFFVELSKNVVELLHNP
jgi:hypothetical protein